MISFLLENALLFHFAKGATFNFKCQFIKNDAFAKKLEMVKQKFRPTRLGGFSGAKAYIYVVCQGPEKPP